MMEQDKSPRSGVPAGFSDDIRTSGLPDFEAKKGVEDYSNVIKIACLGLVALILIISIVAFISIIIKSANRQKYSEEDLVKAYVEILGGEEIDTFEPFVYEDSENSSDLQSFLKASKKLFNGKTIFSDKTEIGIGEVDDKTVSNINSLIGEKVKKPSVVSFDVYYSDGEDEPTKMTTFRFYTGRVSGSAYLAYGSSEKTVELNQEEEIIATGGNAEEATEEAKEDVSVDNISVGNSDIGKITVPNNFVLSGYDTSTIEGIESKFAYKSPDKDSYVILIKFKDKASDLKAKTEEIMSKLVPEYSVVSGNEVGRFEESFFGKGESGNSKVEVTSITGAGDGLPRAIVVISDKNDTLFDVWNTYGLEQGFSAPAQSPLSNIPEGMQGVGDDELGYLIIANDFEEDTEYNYDNSKGWTRGDETIVLVSYKETAQENLPLSEFADIMKDNFLGKKGEEFTSGDWFKGALYSKRVDDDKVSELYCFKGEDGINRVILVYSPEEGSEVSDYYSSFYLPCGVKEETD